MAAVRSWLFSVVLASMLLSLVRTLLPEGGVRRAASFTGGLLLLLALLRPAAGLGGVSLEMDGCAQEIEERREELEAENREELRSLIESRTAAYILEHGGVSASVTAEEDENGILRPAAAEVEGPYSQALSEWMESELGIRRERQVWGEP